jgi:hypothetical protein
MEKEPELLLVGSSGYTLFSLSAYQLTGMQACQLSDTSYKQFSFLKRVAKAAIKVLTAL